MNSFTRKNNQERMRFVTEWADYVRTHPDKDWSRQQNVIINSALRTASISKEDYLKMKGDKKPRNISKKQVF
ncbi:MAG: hypothetical protein NT038_09345 [Euryarchaeota archaeon]|nr:hypothetical protein [Euryarchaeota archaeon]